MHTVAKPSVLLTGTRRPERTGNPRSVFRLLETKNRPTQVLNSTACACDRAHPPALSTAEKGPVVGRLRKCKALKLTSGRRVLSSAGPCTPNHSITRGASGSDTHSIWHSPTQPAHVQLGNICFPSKRRRARAPLGTHSNASSKPATESPAT